MTIKKFSESFPILLTQLVNNPRSKNRQSIRESYLNQFKHADAYTRLLEESIDNIRASKKPLVFSIQSGFYIFKLLNARAKDHFAGLRLHIYDPALKTAEVAEGSHTHMWDFSSLTIKGKITHFFTKELKLIDKCIAFIKNNLSPYVVFEYKEKDNVKGKRQLYATGKAFLSAPKSKSFSTGEVASLDNTTIHTVTTAPDTVTLLLNHGYPESRKNRMFFKPDKIPKSLRGESEANLSYTVVPKDTAIQLLKKQINDIRQDSKKKMEPVKQSA